MKLVNFDVIMYMLIRTIKDLQKDGRKDLAMLVEEIAKHLQSNLDEIVVETCPACGARFDGGAYDGH